MTPANGKLTRSMVEAPDIRRDRFSVNVSAGKGNKSISLHPYSWAYESCARYVPS